MSNSNLTRSHEPGTLSMIGGAANSGSAKPKEELEKMNRQNEQRQEDSPAGAGESPGKVGGTSNDSRTDQERSSGSQSH